MMTDIDWQHEPKMSADNELFERAVTAAKSLPDRPDNNTLLKLYALFKQGSVGDVRGDKPGFMDFVGSAKYEAWAKLAGMPGTEAQALYIELVRKLGGPV